MVIVEEKKEENVLAGYPVRKTFFKDDEVLHYDKLNKQWIAKTAPYTKDEIDAIATLKYNKTGGTMTGDIRFDTSAIGPLLKSPDGNLWRITVDNSGTLGTTAI